MGGGEIDLEGASRVTLSGDPQERSKVDHRVRCRDVRRELVNVGHVGGTAWSRPSGSATS